jgi:hypothetical protein
VLKNGAERFGFRVMGHQKWEDFYTQN